MIATSLRFSNSAYAATDAGEPLTSSPMTGVLADGGPSEIRTTLTSAPLAVNPFASAAERGKPALCRWIRTENAELKGPENPCSTTGKVDRKLDKAVKVITTGGCHLRVRRERLLGEVSGGRLTHPGLAGFPTPLTIHTGCVLPVGGTSGLKCRAPTDVRIVLSVIPTSEAASLAVNYTPNFPEGGCTTTDFVPLAVR